MSHVLCGYLFSRASNIIDTFDPLNIFQANRLSANPALFHHLRVPRRLAWLLPWREMRCFESIVRRSCGRSQLATDTGGFLVGYRYNFNRWLAAEANYGYDRNTQIYFGGTGTRVESNIHQITGSAVVKLPSFARLQPYALAGGGALVFDPTRNAGGNFAGATTETRGAFVYGAGADYAFTRHISLRAEYRGYVYKAPDFNLAGLNTDSWTHMAQPSAGIVFRF